MPVVVKVDWNSLDYFKVKKVLGDMLPVFTAVGVEVLKEVGRNFEAAGIWTKWAPLKPNTLAGRRQGASSRPLQASGQLRASFRMEPMKSQVRVGSPLALAAMHHEGRRGPWTIKPKKAKALAFAVAQGGAPVGSPAAFQSYGHKKRNARFLSGVPMAVVMSVRHPGYPARPMLPPSSRAMEIAQAVVTKFIEMAKGA